MSGPGSPLPAALEVRELLEGLLGRDVEAKVGTGAVNPNEPPGAVVGIYTDDHLALKAIAVVDVPFACYAGGAIALVPPRTVQAAVDDEIVLPDLLENVCEVLNVAASLFNKEGAPHLRLYATYAPRETNPPDVQKWVLAYVQRLDMTVTVTGYGTGRMSVLVI